MDSPLPPITPEPAPAAAAANATASRAERGDERADPADTFSAALDREMTRDTNAKSSRAKADPAPGKAEGQDAREEPANSAGTPEGPVLPLLISPPVPATPPDAAVPRTVAALNVSAALPKAIPGASSSARIAAPERAVPAASPETGKTTNEASGAAARFPDVPGMLRGETPAVPSTFSPIPDRESTHPGRDTLRALTDQAHVLTAHADVTANNIPLMPAELRSAHPAAVSSPAVNPDLALAPRVGTTEWNDALAHKVTWMVGEHQKIADLQLNPPDLGPLEIRVTMSGDDNATASAQFSSPHAPVREALEAAIPRLREMLAESGITLGNTTIADSALPREGRDDPSRRSAPLHTGEQPVATTTPGANSIRVAAVQRNHGLVDIFA